MARTAGEAGAMVVGGCLFIALLVIALNAITALVLMIGWNLVMPYAFGLPELNFLQAFGLSLVAGVIFSGVRAVATK